MTQLSSICRALLDGETISIMTGFKDFGCTNIPREIGNVERKFGIIVNRERVNFVSRYKQHGSYMNYSFTPGKQNKESLKEMKKYVNEQESK
jgi:hypothetical protein